MTNETMQYIVARLTERAREAKAEFDRNRDNSFASGRSEAYYEMLDILKSELDAAGQDLSEYGLDFDLVGELA